jgi:hypothetical protein
LAKPSTSVGNHCGRPCATHVLVKEWSVLASTSVGNHWPTRRISFAEHGGGPLLPRYHAMWPCTSDTSSTATTKDQYTRGQESAAPPHPWTTLKWPYHPSLTSTQVAHKSVIPPLINTRLGLGRCVGVWPRRHNDLTHSHQHRLITCRGS